MSEFATFQIGKSRITKGVLSSLALALKNHYQVRISFLKSSGRTRDTINSMAQEICEKLPQEKGKKYIYKAMGFTIILSKVSQRKEVRFISHLF